MPFGRLSCLLKSGIIQTFFFLYYQYSWKTHIYNIKWLSISRSYHDLCRKFINSHFALQNIHLTINIYTYIYHYDVDKVVNILTFLQIIHTNADVSCVVLLQRSDDGVYLAMFINSPECDVKCHEALTSRRTLNL